VAQAPNGPKIFNNKELSDHFALIPTGTALSPTADADTQQLYQVIAKRFVAAFCPPEKVAVVTRRVKVGEDTFETQMEQTLDPGWRAVYARPVGFVKGPSLAGNSGDQAPVQSIAADIVQTEPPPPHTEATLLEQMSKNKDASLGTPATRANIIEGIKARGYIAPSPGDGWESTPKGRQLVGHLRKVGLSELSSSDLTGKWEAHLKKIGDGIETLPPFIQSIRDATQQCVDVLLERKKPGNDVAL
jgi:DNA topoisomerase-3